MDQEQWRPRVTVAAVVEKRQRFLLIEEQVAGERVWNQPAGHLEQGEDLLAAVRREVLEETCRRFEPQGLVGVYRWQAPESGDTYLRFCFAGTVTDVDAAAARDPDILGERWMTLEDIDRQRNRLRSPLVYLAIEDYRRQPTAPLALIHDVQS